MSDEETKGERLLVIRDIAGLVDREAETLVACPWCDGHGLVTHDKATRWKAAYPELEEKPDG